MNMNYGGFFVLHRDGRPALILSDAFGMDKVKPLISNFIDNYSDVNKLVQINLGTNGFLYKKDLDQWDQDNLRFTSHYVSSVPSFYETINAELKKLMFQSGITPNIYLSGLDDFVEEVYTALEQSGFNKENIIVDNNEGASCGGGCNSCSSGC